VLELRTFTLGDGGSAVTVRGDLDAASVAPIAAAVARCTGGAVVVDLRHARLVDAAALDTLAARVHATFVAERPLRDALERRPVTVAATLRAAFTI
jgi:anti-anti-sigma regulatory factor